MDAREPRLVGDSVGRGSKSFGWFLVATMVFRRWRRATYAKLVWRRDITEDKSFYVTWARVQEHLLLLIIYA